MVGFIFSLANRPIWAGRKGPRFGSAVPRNRLHIFRAAPFPGFRAYGAVPFGSVAFGAQTNSAADGFTFGWLALTAIGLALFSAVMVFHWIRLKKAVERGRQENRATSRERERLQAMMESLAYPIFQLGADGCLVHCNSSFAKALERVPAEVMGRRVSELLFGMLDAQGEAHLKKILEKRGHRRLVLAVDLPSGSRQVEVHLSPLVGHEKGAVIGVCRDITVLNRKKKALRASKEQLQSIGEYASDAIVTLDPKGQVTFWNPAAERMFGFSAGEIMGRPFHDFICWPEELEEASANFPNFAETGTGNIIGVLREVRAKRKDRTEFIAEISVSAIRRGTKFGAIGLVRDITVRKKEEERFKAVFEHASDAYVLFDRSGFIDCNRSALELFDAKSKEELMSHGLTEISAEIQPDGRRSKDLIGSIIDGAMSEGNRQLEWTHRSFTGRAFPSLVTLIRLELSQKPTLLAIVRDISRHKQIEQNLKRAKENAEETSKAKSRFLATMSHEIRTPLNAITGMVELLALTSLQPRQRKKLEVIGSAATNLLGIVRNILDFSLLEAGQLELEMRAFDILAMFEFLGDSYGKKVREKRLGFEMSLDPALERTLISDEYRLRQILTALLDNALKFTRKGKIKLAVTVKKTTVKAQTVEIAVADTGIGLSTDLDLSKIIPFVQIENSTTRSFGGTGLGLALSQRLAQKLSATLGVKPGREMGTVATLALMLKRPKSAAGMKSAGIRQRPAKGAHSAKKSGLPPLDEPLSRAEACEKNRLALVVEDHPTNQEILRRQLEVLGFYADVAENGSEGFSKWRSGNYRFVITDCHMPIMDGFQLGKLIREAEEGTGKRTPVFAVSASNLADEKEMCKKVGMDGFLTKPTSLWDLRKVLGSSSDRPPLAGEPGRMPVSGHNGVSPAPTSFQERNTFNLELLLNTFGDKGTVKQVLKEFVKTNDEDLAALTAALETRNISEIVRTAHRIKGAAKYIDSKPLAEASQRMEQAGRAGDWEGIQSLIPDFYTIVQSVAAEIDGL